MNTPSKVGRSKKATGRCKWYLLKEEYHSFVTSFPLTHTNEDVEAYGRTCGFTSAVGPFRTRFGAELCQQFGPHPVITTTEQWDDKARELLQAAQNTIEDALAGDEEAETTCCDLAAEYCQMFRNVAHMDWYKEALAMELFQ